MDDIEALTALMGLQMILNLGFSNLLLEGDSLFVIEAIGSKEPNYLRQGNIISEIQSLLCYFMKYDVFYEDRQGN